MPVWVMEEPLDPSVLPPRNRRGPAVRAPRRKQEGKRRRCATEHDGLPELPAARSTPRDRTEVAQARAAAGARDARAEAALPPIDDGGGCRKKKTKRRRRASQTPSRGELEPKPAAEPQPKPQLTAGHAAAEAIDLTADSDSDDAPPTAPPDTAARAWTPKEVQRAWSAPRDADELLRAGTLVVQRRDLRTLSGGS